MLLVDDEPIVQTVVTRVLAGAGYLVVAASSVTEARAVLANQPPFDIVLLDRSMPGGRGEELVPQLRSGPADPIILLFTGEPVTGQVEGIDAVLQKPLGMPELIEAIESAVRLE